MRIAVECPEVAATAKSGASIAIDGVCLSVAGVSTSTMEFDVVPETLARSTLGGLRAGDMVNLEPSLRLGDPLDGQIVYGHVDATTTILRREREGPGYRISCATPPALAGLICEKGYIALDGVSLTVAEVESGRSFAVVLIPETLKRTTLGGKGPGAKLNVEADPVARYVASLIDAARRAQLGEGK